MRIDKFVPESKRTGVSVYYNDYKQRFSVDCSTIKPTSVYRKNRPHPPQNFLEPRYDPDESIQLQKRVRNAVHKYLTEIYQAPQQNREDTFNRTQHFGSPTLERSFTKSPYRPRSPTPLQQNCYAGRYPSVQSASTPMRIAGHGYSNRPASAIGIEKYPSKQLLGESKRDRSVRINQEIKGKTRLTTPIPQRQVWQDSKVSVPNDQHKPHWVRDPQKEARKKRIVSAPPGTKGFTHYPQQTAKGGHMDTENMTSRLEEWAQHASNYEKQVVFKMLKQVSPRPDGVPQTPESRDFLMRAQSLPLGDPPQSGHGVAHYAKRHVTSAPVKKMAGLVSSSTQYPHRDQRNYRLKGQDTRIDPTPAEERDLNFYMDKMRTTSYPISKSDRKYAAVPMHTYPSKKKTGAQDYQCKVSFFQTVRSPFKSHFVIHPDFTSEEVKKRKQVSHDITHFKY